MELNLRIQSITIQKKNFRNLKDFESQYLHKGVSISYIHNKKIKIIFDKEGTFYLGKIKRYCSQIDAFEFYTIQESKLKNSYLNLDEFMITKENSNVSLSLLETIFMLLKIQVDLVGNQEDLLLVNLKNYRFKNTQQQRGFEDLFEKSIRGIYKLS